MAVVHGKDTLRALRTTIQNDYGISLSDNLIVGTFRKDEIPEDLQQLIYALDEYRRYTPE
jgi:hypothetical protein